MMTEVISELFLSVYLEFTKKAEYPKLKKYEHLSAQDGGWDAHLTDPNMPSEDAG